MTLIINSVLPIFAVIAFGSFLKRAGWLDDAFLRTSDRMIYYLFFPCLLFWKIGKPAKTGTLEWDLILCVLSAVFLVFGMSLLFVRLFRVPDYEVGSFSQSCYRFSTYIGMALLLSSVGEEGVRLFGILIGFVIPFINVLAVSSMIFYSGETATDRGKVGMVLKAMVSNPLIVACVSGVVYARVGPAFPLFVENTFALVSLLTLPLALLSIGGTLTFSGLKNHLGRALTAAAFKLVVLPVVGYALLKVFCVADPAFTVAMIYFALPTSPQNFILSSQLNSDIELATSAIVLSTVLSMASLSAVLLIFGQ
jgi:hypothetical protein